MKRIGLMGLMLGLLGASAATGAILNYSVVVNNDGANYASGTGGTFELPQFNGELGTLQRVILTVTGYAYDGSLAVDNEWSAAGKVQLELGTYIAVMTPGGEELLFAPSWTSPLTTVAADDDGTADYTGADAALLSGSVAVDTQSDNPASLASYIGAETITYSFLSEGFFTVLALSPLDVEGRLEEDVSLPTYSLTAQITYEYAGKGGGGEGGGTVPEPGTLAMGLALAGLSLATWGARRRSARQRE